MSSAKTAVVTVVAITMGKMIERLFNLVGTTFIGLEADTDVRMNKGGRGGVPVNTLHGKVGKKSKIGGYVGAGYESVVNNARIREAIEKGLPVSFRLDDDVRQACLDSGVVTEQEIIDYEQARTAEIQARIDDEISACNGDKDKAIENIVKSNTERFEAKERAWGKHVQTGCKFDAETMEVKPVFSNTLIEHTKDDEHRFYVQMFVLSHRQPVYYNKETGKELTESEIDYIRQYIPKKDDGARQGLDNPIIIRDYRVDNVKTIRMNKTQYNIV